MNQTTVRLRKINWVKNQPGTNSATHLSRTMEGLAKRDDAKEAVESIAATGIWVGVAGEPGSKSESLSALRKIWNVLAG